MNPPNHGTGTGVGQCGTTLSTPAIDEPKTHNGVVDAGLRSIHHYKRALPKWRYDLRQKLLPIVRWETPYLAAIQSSMRTPALDSYFAITANLGTHTFFMVFLPILFWCGFREFGKGLVHILASGVFFTGFIKDMCSLPRPLSPPLQRITMSGSAALEYGFPSTHSANAVSVAVYGMLMLRRDTNTLSPTTTLALEGLAYFYALSIVFGRLYCGMHGFVDVIIGSLTGAAISLVEFYYAPGVEAWLYSSSYLAPLAIALLIIVLVRVHPEPADDCPCFDDSVAFAGVMIGVEGGTWRFARFSRFAHIYNGPDASFDLSALGWPRVIARLVFGVAVVFAWREVMKPTLLRFLPHLYRVIETHGLSLPRRFFVPASEYKDVPLHVRDDNVLPNVSDLPKLVRSIRGPGRGRSVSIGPQSAADAYETLAYRERRRRESLGSDAGGGGGGVRGKRSLSRLREKVEATAKDGECSQVSGVQSGGRLAEYEKMMGAGTVAAGPTLEVQDANCGVAGRAGMYLGEDDELDDEEVFSNLVKPRVRYDVEVVTKLVVYTGIAWLAVDGILVAFEAIGLGAGHLSTR
ncbi:phosphatidic acid phosphatase type 2/haloperoxidase [Chaetomium strumarium]|uniref:Phosphatidic acid phosphatase type 2/haloperoxidase n=1 Tax=Chaetomium strumarium TaxID=1170767 RepID=A0AAJ0M072_9PEZI|nr:phosphatidic acid phosphatase type 2/haloperoxidase [Chaetomium strumarium]